MPRKTIKKYFALSVLSFLSYFSTLFTFDQFLDDIGFSVFRNNNDYILPFALLYHLIVLAFILAFLFFIFTTLTTHKTKVILQVIVGSVYAFFISLPFYMAIPDWDPSEWLHSLL